jgi:hypothetical protein
MITHLNLLTSTAREFLRCAVYCVQEDVGFARQLCEDLRDAGMRCWVRTDSGPPYGFDKWVIVISRAARQAFQFVRGLESWLRYSPQVDSMVFVLRDDAITPWLTNLAGGVAINVCDSTQDPETALRRQAELIDMLTNPRSKVLK